VRRADNLTTFMCRLTRNSRSLNLLEPSGPVQASKTIALPFNVLDILDIFKYRTVFVRFLLPILIASAITFARPIGRLQ